MVIDAVHKSWLRPEGEASTLIGVELGVGHADPRKFDEGVDQAYVTHAREKLAARFPAFADAPMRGGWAGMIMMSPDGRPIIDQIPSVPGLYVMLGDSGSNTLGAMLGFESVGRLTERQRWSAIAALAGLTLLGERRSLGALIERTPVVQEVDAWGRQPV